MRFQAAGRPKCIRGDRQTERAGGRMDGESQEGREGTALATRFGRRATGG